MFAKNKRRRPFCRYEKNRWKTDDSFSGMSKVYKRVSFVLFKKV
ncbi:hypothetical protein CHCC20335_2852 [Bacillus paralicheniformis]|nr:hypothetical protein CHCC20335_2852 [Bacillus paralicheniformis]